MHSVSEPMRGIRGIPRPLLRYGAPALLWRSPSAGYGAQQAGWAAGRILPADGAVLPMPVCGPCWQQAGLQEPPAVYGLAVGEFSWAVLPCWNLCAVVAVLSLCSCCCTLRVTTVVGCMDCTFGGWLADVGHDCNALFTSVIKVLGIPPPTTSSSLAMSECGD